MTNVSKKELDVQVKEKLFKEFSSLFLVAGKERTGALFLELFTESEQIMFIKRVGIVLMLAEDCSNYAIAKSLEVSTATVRSAKLKFLAGEYDKIAGVVHQTTFDNEKFWSTMAVVLRGGLPPMGRDRWKSVLRNKK